MENFIDLDNVSKKFDISLGDDNKLLKLLMSMLDAYIDENGNITCRLCGLPNECCKCGYEEP